jgi:16S rRNA (cytosine967-C5)-methyltransferase
LDGRAPRSRLGIRYSYPDDLVDGWIRAYGEPAAASIAAAGNVPPAIFLRARAGRTTAEDLARNMAQDGVEVEILGPTSLAIRRGSGQFRESQAFRDGLFSVQDLTSQRVAPLVSVPEGGRVLDLCAAPGGKAAHLSELGAQVLACDLHPGRLNKIHETARRLGLSIETLRADGRKAEDFAHLPLFDAVLVDAPCSNTGVLRRRPEARWRYSAASQNRHVRDQESLLEMAYDRLRPGGCLVYSVCSIEPEEGIERLQGLAAAKGVTVDFAETLLPKVDGGDGGFMGRLFRPIA